MAGEMQHPGIVEDATTGDVEDELQSNKTKSAEDRKAAAALSKLDARDDDVSSATAIDSEGLSKAMNKLNVGKAAAKVEVKRVKVDASDVALLMEELDLNKLKATELLKQHEGDAVLAMKAFIAVT